MRRPHSRMRRDAIIADRRRLRIGTVRDHSGRAVDRAELLPERVELLALARHRLGDAVSYGLPLRAGRLDFCDGVGIKERPTRLLHAACVLKALRAVELGDGLSLDLVSVKQGVVGEALQREVNLPHEVDAVLDAGVQPLADGPIGSCRRELPSPPFSCCRRCRGRRRLKKRRRGAAEFMQAASACLHARRRSFPGPRATGADEDHPAAVKVDMSHLDGRRHGVACDDLMAPVELLQSL